MNRDQKYNRSEKGLARYARYRKRHWLKIYVASQSYETERKYKRLMG